MRFMVLVVVMLAGCASVEERQARATSQRDAMIARMAATCDKMGFKSGSDAHSQCQLDLVKATIAGDAAVTAGAAARPVPQVAAPKTCTMVGNSMTCY